MVVAFYFRLHLAYFPRPVVAIFARPEQRQGLYTQPDGTAACEVPGVGAGADGGLIRCRRSFPAFRYAPLRKTALYYHAFQILGVSRLHIS